MNAAVSAAHEPPRLDPRDARAIASYYAEHGYALVANHLDSPLIDAFMLEYERLKRRWYYLYRSQDTNRGERVKPDVHGHLIHSILDPKDLTFLPRFRRAVRACLTTPATSRILQQISGRRSHVIYQSMFFDKSTGTVAHQDHYYLDSEPPGHNIAIWLALEDIHEDAGYFFVVPNSHRGPVVENDPHVPQFSDHEQYVAKMACMIREQGYQPISMRARRGDAILWHPLTVHGSFPNKNPAHSRKSLTCHYTPDGYGVRFRPRLPRTRAIRGTDFREWLLPLNGGPRGFVKSYASYALRRVRPARPRMEMRQTEIDDP